MDKILQVIIYSGLALASVANLISAFIGYLSCDSCKAKRLERVAKLIAKSEQLQQKEEK